MKNIALLQILLFTTILTAQSGLVGEYYNGINFEQKVLTRTDAKIDFGWWGESPEKGVVNEEYYSIRWTGKIVAPETGKYLFSAKFDDGLRLWVNDVPMLNAWDLHNMGNYSNYITLEAGKAYTLKVEFFNAMREGEITLLWQIPSQVNDPNFAYNNFKPVSAQYLFQPNYTPPVIAKKTPIVQPKPQTRNPKPIQPVSTFEKMDKDLDIKQVFFIRSVDKMTDNSLERLDKVAEFLKNNAKAKLELNGHTDVMGDAKMNMELSVKRAKVVSDYLISKGISENRIAYRGFGGTQPLIADPKTEEERAVNRRVEFVIK